MKKHPHVDFEDDGRCVVRVDFAGSGYLCDVDAAENCWRVSRRGWNGLFDVWTAGQPRDTAEIRCAIYHAEGTWLEAELWNGKDHRPKCGLRCGREIVHTTEEANRNIFCEHCARCVTGRTIIYD